ncbi:MAG: molybdopterin converting factor subunit 1 [Burkholderiales bacterium]
MVKVLFFARLREVLGVSTESIELPAGIATVGALRSHLISRGGAWSDAFAEGRAVRVAVNQDMAQASTAIKAGDEVAFFPPVTGG